MCASSVGWGKREQGLHTPWGLRKEEAASGWSPAPVSYSLTVLKRRCQPVHCVICLELHVRNTSVIRMAKETFVLRFTENTLRSIDSYQFTSFCHKRPPARRYTAVCCPSVCEPLLQQEDSLRVRVLAIPHKPVCCSSL